MDPKQNLYDLQMEANEIFKAQDYDAGDFDVTFLIDGEKLYAHKHRLTSVSPTFRSMLSDRWTSKDEPIEIKNYTFEDFKEFLSYIYSGTCSFDPAKILVNVDIAEFYGVKAFKNTCDTFLATFQFSSNNFLHFNEIADKYSLPKMKKALISFISKNFASFIKSPEFHALQKDGIKNVIQLKQNSFRPEELFEQVYKWAENQATEKQKADETLILNNLIKEELSDILPLINFKDMYIKFLLNFVVKKSFLFSGDELSDILLATWGKVYVKIFDENERIMKGVLDCPEMERFCNAIQSQKNVFCVHRKGLGYIWPTNQPKPTAPSKLINNDKIQWYLVCDKQGNLSIKDQRVAFGDYYLLAEMSAEPGFFQNGKYKIEVFPLS